MKNALSLDILSIISYHALRQIAYRFCFDHISDHLFKFLPWLRYWNFS